MSGSPAEAWQGLLRPEVELTPAFCASLNARMRAERLTFGDRVHCPFLRPFFLTAADEARVRHVAESIARLGERVARQALEEPALAGQLALSAEEEHLAHIPAPCQFSSDSSRLDAFLLPDSLKLAEYNAESPAGLGYADLLAELFQGLEVMARFRNLFEVRREALVPALLSALLETYREWGGTASPPVAAIVDWREVPTWTEFEILQARFRHQGVPAILADPRDLEFDGHVLVAGGRRIDLVYRRVLTSDVIRRPAECRALVDAFAAGAICMSNTFACKFAHKKAFFAVLTDERNQALFDDRESQLIRRHVPWTRLVADTRATRDGRSFGLLEHIREFRDQFVLKPNDEYGGTGVTLGWEAGEREWIAALDRAVADSGRAWVVQERIPVRRENFPMQTGEAVETKEMLVDLAPYLFRGRMAGFLTRLSSTGLANVTSGGGQVPCFVVEPRSTAPPSQSGG